MKRESERRQRDRDRSGNIGIPITNGTTGGKRVTIMEDGDIGTSQYTLVVGYLLWLIKIIGTCAWTCIDKRDSKISSTWN